MSVLAMFSNPHYQAISSWYGTRCANRSKVPLMNHIHEGLAVLGELGADLETQGAFCLHPILQENDALYAAISPNPPDLGNCSVPVLLLAVAYRIAANSYLSKDYRGKDDHIQLSPVEAVNQMLIADKVQNLKDFELYHPNHPNAANLRAYFWNWLQKLDVSESRYKELVSIMKLEEKTCR